MPLLTRLLPYALAFASSLCIMILELVSSRLVAPHVGSSLTVWTSVIGIILGGICLGNVLGGRLSDRVDPRAAVGPLFALGAFLTISTLWINSQIPRLLPAPDQMNWELRTVLVVLIDFLIPATVLGMVGPVVAKMAVEQARRAGSAIGDVYFWGAVGSICGTMLCGFVLQLYFGTSTITLLVAAGLSLLAAALIASTPARITALLTALFLVAGSIRPMAEQLGAVELGAYRISYIAVVGNVLSVILAMLGIAGLLTSRRPQEMAEPDEIPLAADPKGKPQEARTGLADLAILAFLASMTFMAMEMVAGRLVTRHLGSSIYGWSSVIAVLLAGLSLGNLLGGKIADYIRSEKQASWLFLVAAVLTLLILPLESPPEGFLQKYFDYAPHRSLLSKAQGLKSLAEIHGPDIPLSWPFRILTVTIGMFFLPSLAMGTVSPVVAKLAVDRLRQVRRTGSAIGQVYAWGMVGSILGTFLTGFFLIDYLGTKGVILVIGTILALGATFLGELFDALVAGIPLGLCVIAFTPPGWVDVVSKVIPAINGKSFAEMGQNWGVREPIGDPKTTDEENAWIDESDYYFIKVENEPEEGGKIQRRTLVLDNLIHGYFILDHPQRLDYDYEHIYALVAYRAAKAGGQVTFKPGADGEPAQESKPKAGGEEKKTTSSPKAEEKPAGNEKKPAGGLRSVSPADTQEKKPAADPPKPTKTEPASQPPKTVNAPNSARPEPTPKPESKPTIDLDKTINIDSLKDLTNLDLDLETAPEPVIPPVESSKLKTLFLGGGAYCFQRHMQFAYPGTSVDVAEIDPAVTRANQIATGLPSGEKATIQTYWGDARQFVELHQDTNKYDLIFGDAFNDFSVPWHLTTREFNDKIKKMLTPNGVYMINIIDAYYSDEQIEKQAEKEIQKQKVTDEAGKTAIREKFRARALRFGGFVGAWTRTARLTFGENNVYLFGTDDPGRGRRETFVVVASMKPLDLQELGLRQGDPRYYTPKGDLTTPKPYDKKDLDTIVDRRSRQIVLTDDFAPVENLLAPVAETRAED